MLKISSASQLMSSYQSLTPTMMTPTNNQLTSTNSKQGRGSIYE